MCDRTTLLSTASTVYMVGFFLGCLVASILADRFGRKKVIVVAGCLASLMGTIDPFIPNIYAFLVVRTLIAFFLNIVSPTLYVLGKITVKSNV